MNKQKLPKDWIVVNSKSHPDRVYYFNVKAKKSSWTIPTEDSEEESKAKHRNKKRKKQDQDESVSSGAITPERTTPEHEVTGRKKLVARRSILPCTDLQQDEDTKTKKVAKNMKETKESNETPQMKILREKIRKKKEKPLNRSSTSEVSSTVSSPKSTEFRTSLPKERPSRSLPKTEIGDKDSTSGFTPQMKVMFEKMQRRLSEGSGKRRVSDLNSSKNDRRKTKGGEVGQRSPRRLSAQKTSVEHEEVQVTSTGISPGKGSQRTTTRKKLSDTPLEECSSTKRGARSFLKKNMAAERMHRLKRRLEMEKELLEKRARKSVDACEESAAKKTVPHIYKNAQVRLVRLKEKLLKEKLSSKVFDEARSKNDEVITLDENVTTVTDLVKQSVENAFCEEMEWEPMEDEEITSEVQTVRSQLCANNTSLRSNVPDNVLSELSPMQRGSRKLYIVVDTNVLLSNIQAVDLARETEFKTYDRPIIVIPWTVIRELDYIKDDKKNQRSTALCVKARRAVQYLNKLFDSKHPRFIGQTPEDAEKNKEKFAVDCPDDEILQTCLQIRELGKSVALLTYDKNLCNKAMIHDIVTLGRNDPFEKIDYLNASSNGNNLTSIVNTSIRDEDALQPMSFVDEEMRVSNEIFDEVGVIIKDFLTVIMRKEMHGLYGDSWEKYVIIPPPWTTVSVLKCAVKHWIAATSESFLRKAEDTLKELLRIFNATTGLKRLKDVGHLLEKCNDLIQMVNTDRHLDLMLRCTNKVQELRKTFAQFEKQLSEKRVREIVGVEPDVLQQQHRADKAFKYFEVAYAYARDMCGLAAKALGMPCSIPHEIPNPVPPLEYVKRIQPELAANVNRLLHTLSAALEEASIGSINPASLVDLCEILDNFLPETMLPTKVLTPLDVYCCVKRKEEVLRTGLRQLQDLSTHFCRLASYRCT